MTNHRYKKGFGLVEVIVAVAVISVAFFGLLQTGVVALRLLRAEKENLQATLLAEEALEAVRSVRDEAWNKIAALSDGVPYYPLIQNGKWVFSENSSGLIDNKFSRSTVSAQVFRDANDKIASSGTLDPDTKKITARVSWTGLNPKQFELTTYLTNFQQFLNQASETLIVSFEGAATDADLANFPGNSSGDGDPVQGFTTPAETISVSGAELLLRGVTADPSDIFVELRQSPTGKILGTSQIINSEAIASTTPAWVVFRFSPPVQLSALTSYVLRLRSQPDSTISGSGSVGLIHWLYQQAAPSPYSGGEARRYVGRLGNPDDSGQLLDQYDFGFRIYRLQ